jgi:hypothetical protein
MTQDLTLLYYTANLITDHFAERVRSHLERCVEQLSPAGEALPIVSVSQKPIAFGRNICVGDIGASTYNVYKQILIGAEAATTPYIACCEDDTLYPPEHLAYRPPTRDVFAYNLNRWWIEPEGHYRHRRRPNMSACIASTALMVEALRERFAKFPTPSTDRKQLNGWGEPGRYEENLGLPQRALLYFETSAPVVSFDHKPSLGGIRRRGAGDVIQDDLPPWGNGRELWSVVHG